jgi:glycosyltransferase involved in cell wall biosynthesis
LTPIGGASGRNLILKWGSLDSFLVQDKFWQDKMGKPIANKDFMLALLTHGALDSYRFYYLDEEDLAAGRASLEDCLPADRLARIAYATQSQLAEDAEAGEIDILHQGDFTFHAPYLMEYRAGATGAQPFAISGLTHSLDGVKIQARLIDMLLAGPRPCDAIVCTSDCARRMLRAAFSGIAENFKARFGAALPEPPQLVHIPLGIADDFEQMPERGQCRAALGFDDGELVLLCLGRFSARRKMDLGPMLECLQYLRALGALPPFTLILAGGGSQSDVALTRDIVETLGLGDCVRIEANHDFAAKRQLYGAADIFVSLVDNYQETFGLTVIEAMAHGLPAIVSEFNGYRELVHDGETGFRVPTYASADEAPWQSLAGVLDPSLLGFYRGQKVAFDFKRFAEALTALAGNAELRREMGGRAKRLSREYLWSRLIPRYEEMWRLQHETALKTNGDAPPNSAPPLLVPDHQRVFGHYASRVLDGQTQVRVSDYCRARAAENFKPIQYAAHGGRIRFAIMQALMTRLAGAPRDAPLALGVLIEETARDGNLPPETVMHNFDFLLKHGYIEIAAAG